MKTEASKYNSQEVVSAWRQIIGETTSRLSNLEEQFEEAEQRGDVKTTPFSEFIATIQETPIKMETQAIFSTLREVFGTLIVSAEFKTASLGVTKNVVAKLDLLDDNLQNLEEKPVEIIDATVATLLQILIREGLADPLAVLKLMQADDEIALPEPEATVEPEAVVEPEVSPLESEEFLLGAEEMYAQASLMVKELRIIGRSKVMPRIVEILLDVRGAALSVAQIVQKLVEHGAVKDHKDGTIKVFSLLRPSQKETRNRSLASAGLGNFELVFSTLEGLREGQPGNTDIRGISLRPKRVLFTTITEDQADESSAASTEVIESDSPVVEVDESSPTDAEAEENYFG